MDSFWKGFSCVRKLSLAHRCRTAIQEESISPLEGILNGPYVRAAGAEDSRWGVAPVTTYTYLWEFVVESEHVDDFERHYGPQGSWVQLFRQAAGYIDTLLLRDSTNPQRFITIDRWENEEAYREFRTEFSQQYATLDRLCENLAMRETLIGEFSEPTI